MTTKSGILAEIEERSEQSAKRVRDLIRSENPDYLPTHDAGMEEIKSGRHGLRMLWESISPAQQRLIRSIADGPRKLVKSRGTDFFYDLQGSPGAETKAARAATVRALVAHHVLKFEEARDDAEFTAVLDQRGYDLLAVLKAQN